jgi:hypothetical protein
MIKFLLLFIVWFTYSIPAVAVGSIIAGALLLTGAQAAIVAFAINMVASMIISKIFAPNLPNQQTEPNVGNRQQVPPAGDNKLPVVYGSAWVGGIIVDMSISEDNQDLYWVMALSEVTNSENGNTPDVFTFGDVYWGGKKCVFSTTAGETYKVTGLLDESTGLTQDIAGYMDIYLYRNGSYNPANSSSNAISVMNTSGLVYTWDETKLMSNCAFAIVHLKYSQSRNLVSLNQTRFQVINPRNSAGDCIKDYLTSTRYGAAIDVANVDATSITALNTYSNASITYTTYSGGTSTQPRFKFNGTIDTAAKIMNNIQAMADCCDCLIRYSEITSLWGVIVQKPTNTIAMDINDSNMISAISISPIDLSNSFNIIEVKFPDSSAQDSFNSASFDLAVINPALLFPNEPVNKQSVSLILCNNNVQAQYLANRFLEAAREDLQMQVDIDYTGLQLDAGDIVTVTNANYGWVAKEFRIGKVTQKFNESGQVTATLSLMEFNGAVYDDVNVTQFTPAPNTGIGSPITFGVVPAPVILSVGESAAVPYILLSITTSSAGITQYAEIYYSAYQYPTFEQMILAGTTEINANGNPYGQSVAMPSVSLTNISAGNWYFFSRMVNSIASSNFSLASIELNWRPITYQYVDRYVVVAYADDIVGGGFSLDPRGHSYYGLLNVPSASPSLVASDYIWYEATPNPFGTSNYLLFANRQNRRCTFAVSNAAYQGIGGSFVPTETSIYDATLWSGLEDGVNAIDLDMRSGQLTKIGTSSVSSADGLLNVSNNTNGTMIVALNKFLNFGNGVYSKSFSPANLTIDVYGRVVGFTEQDEFFFTETVFTATSGQTSFSVTHIVGQVLVFRNGILVNTTEYTETTSTVVLTNACVTGEIIIVLNMRAVSTSAFYEPLLISIASSTTNSITYNDLPYQKIVAGDLLTFSNTGTPSTFTVSTINYSTKVITFTGTISGATVSNNVYRYRAAGSSYTPFSRWTETFTAVNSYTSTEFLINNGFEQLYVNGSQFNEVDYNLSSNVLDGFPAPVTGIVDIIQFSSNNLGIPCSNITNSVAYSISGALTYTFANNPLAMEVYANGVLLVKGSGKDYTATSVAYNLTTAFDNNFTLLNQQTFARIGAA